jgi:hypothetical protein
MVAPSHTISWRLCCYPCPATGRHTNSAAATASAPAVAAAGTAQCSCLQGGNSSSHCLGYAFRIFFPFRLGLIFGILSIPRITPDSAEDTSEFNHSRARLICSGILRNQEYGQNLEGRTQETWYYVPCVTHIQ